MRVLHSACACACRLKVLKNENVLFSRAAFFIFLIYLSCNLIFSNLVEAQSSSTNH